MLFVSITGFSQLTPEQQKEIEEMQNVYSQSAPDASNMARNAMKIQEDMIRLKNETPLTNDELKEWLPETLNGLPHKSFEIGSQEGGRDVRSVKASYVTPNQSEWISKGTGGDERNPMLKWVRVEVTDGAGEAGSTVLAPMIFMTSMDFETEDANKHEKTVVVDGIRAQQTYTKRNKRTSIIFVYEGRFGISVTSYQINPEETWEIIKLLNLKALTLKATKNFSL